MSGARSGRTPRSDPQFMGELDRRIKALERSGTARVGSWVIGNDPAGRAIITNTEGREVVLTPDPEPTPDVTKPSVSGTTARIFRAATGSVGLPDLGDAPLPNDTFDTIDWASSNMVIDLPTGSIIVPTEGPYLVDLRVEITSDFGITAMQPLLFRDEPLFARGKGLRHDAPGGDGSSNFGWSWTVRCETGGIALRPGYRTSGGESLTGDAAGTLTYFTVTRLAG